MKLFTFNVDTTTDVKVELVQLVSRSELFALRFSRSKNIFGVSELVSVKHIVVNNEEAVLSQNLESLAVTAFGTNSKMYATFLLNGTKEDANDQYFKIMEVRELLQALKTRPACRTRKLEIVK